MSIINDQKEKISIQSKIAFVLGITSTMPIVGVRLGGSYIELFDMTFILFLLVSFVSVSTKKKLTISVTPTKRIYLLFLLWPILSYVVGLMYMPQEWHSSMTSYFVKVIEYIIFTLIVYSSDSNSDAKLFGKGLLIGIISNAIWSILQAITYYIFKQFLNTLVFVQILGLPRGGEIWNSYGGIRVSGFNYDPAHLGGLLPILFFYSLMKKNPYLIILSLISLAFSQSTTALASYAVVIGLILFIRKKKEKKGLKLTGKSLVGIALGLCVVIGGIILLQSNGSITRFYNSILENVNGYFNRINAVYISGNDINPRKIYYTRFLDGLIERGPIVSITGSGLGTSMYPFRHISGLFASGSQNTVTEIETNYIAYLFDIGIVGLSLYLILLFRGLKQFAKSVKYRIDDTSVLYLGFFISIICCSALYHYIFTAYQMLAFAFATIYIDHLLKDNLPEEIV